MTIVNLVMKKHIIDNWINIKHEMHKWFKKIIYKLNCLNAAYHAFTVEPTEDYYTDYYEYSTTPYYDGKKHHLSINSYKY